MEVKTSLGSIGIDDEDVTMQAHGERYTVPTGPVTRARAKRFKEELRSLITKLQDQEVDAAEKEAIKGAHQSRLVHVIQAETTIESSSKN